MGTEEKTFEVTVKVADDGAAVCDISEVMDELRKHHHYRLLDKRQFCGYILSGCCARVDR